MINFLNDAKFTALQKTLDATWQRMNIIAENVANVDTPGYKAKRLEFESILKERIYDTEELHALRLRKKVFPNKTRNTSDTIQPAVYSDPGTQMRVDGNNVDIDHENLELVRTKLQYDYLTRKITDEYNLLKHAVTEGRG